MDFHPKGTFGLPAVHSDPVTISPTSALQLIYVKDGAGIVPN